MTDIIKAINNFGITIYGGEPYLESEYKLKKYNNITYKYKIHRNFDRNTLLIEIDYIRDILQNEELTNYLRDKLYLSDSMVQSLKILEHRRNFDEYDEERFDEYDEERFEYDGVHYSIVCDNLIEKYDYELHKQQMAEKTAKKVKTTNTKKNRK